MTTEIAIAVVERGDCFLVGQRGEDATLADRAEFPGGKMRDGETPLAAARRECWEETGLWVQPDHLLECLTYEYSYDILRLHFVACHYTGPIDNCPSDPFRWVARSELDVLDFPDANKTILHQLRRDIEPKA